MNYEISSQNPVVKAVIEGAAPRPALLAASRGSLPLPQADLLEILVALAHGEDTELRQNAAETLASQDTSSLVETVGSSDVAPSVLGHFIETDGMPASLQEAILANTKTPASSIASFAARTQNGGLLEVISFNQQLLIQNPPILEALIANSNATAEASRRASEIKREFFEKERGAMQIANELRARGEEAAAEFIEQSESELSAEDAIWLASHIEVPDRETDDSWLSLEYIEEVYEETQEERDAAFSKILGELQADGEEMTSDRISMLNRIMRMGVKDRVKLGMKGDREARNILIRDPNKLVSSSVVNNPRITEQEIETIAAMRSISEDILRQIATNRQWSRSYTIGLKLTQNPRTPLANSMTIMSKLQLRDLTALSKNRNVPDAVRRQAVRLLNARTGKG